MSKILTDGLKGSYHDKPKQQNSFKDGAELETSINKGNELRPESTGSSFNQVNLQSYNNSQIQKSNPKKTRYKKPTAIGAYKTDRQTKYAGQTKNVKGSIASKLSLASSQNSISHINAEKNLGSFKKLE